MTEWENWHNPEIRGCGVLLSSESKLHLVNYDYWERKKLSDWKMYTRYQNLFLFSSIMRWPKTFKNNICFNYEITLGTARTFNITIRLTFGKSSNFQDPFFFLHGLNGWVQWGWEESIFWNLLCLWWWSLSQWFHLWCMVLLLVYYFVWRYGMEIQFQSFPLGPSWSYGSISKRIYSSYTLGKEAPTAGWVHGSHTSSS